MRRASSHARPLSFPEQVAHNTAPRHPPVIAGRVAFMNPQATQPTLGRPVRSKRAQLVAWGVNGW